MKANDKRLAAVVVNINGPINEDELATHKARIAKSACALQTVRFVNGDSSLGEACLIFEVYDRDAEFVKKCRHLLRKIHTAALGYIGRRDILVSVVIRDNPGRFPVHGAFQPAKSIPDSLGFVHEVGFVEMKVEDVHSAEDYTNLQM